MISKEIENIIVKFLSNQCSVVELDTLEEWLECEENEKIFQEYVKLNYLIDINTHTFNELAAENIYHNTFKGQVLFLKNVKAIMKYAAILFLIISTALYFYQYLDSEVKQDFGNEVILETESGQVKILKRNASSTIKNDKGMVLGKQEGTSITYKKSESINELVYNTLKVPYGKKITLDLSDGTRVNLNSGTILKYPVNFLNEGNRQVHLVQGEAFFDVMHDPRRPFIVNQKDVNVKVLGTKFNFSSYPEDEVLTTVLVDGSVEVFTENDHDKVILSPGLKATLEQGESNFKVSEADIDLHTAWLEGKIIMKNMEFKSIVKKLERHYDVDIVNEDKILEEEIITATFEGESIEKVLELINKIHPMQYQINGKEIRIYPRKE